VGATSLTRGDVALPLIAVAAVVLGLLVERAFAYPGHLAANATTFAFVLLARRFASAEERVDQLLCIAFAALGELFLCFVWGLYEYRFANIPLFVPLGHSLIFLAGLRVARFAPRGIAAAVVAAGGALVLLLAVPSSPLGLRDGLGLVLFPIFLLCLIPRPSRRLYGTMFVVSFLVELAGTGIGSWRWVERDPWFGLTLTNPPLCAGTFYCVLDLLVVRAAFALRRRQSAGRRAR
jgi:hypothetical protein